MKKLVILFCLLAVLVIPDYVFAFGWGFGGGGGGSGGTGTLSASGTPTNHQWAGWTNATTLMGFTITASKTVCTDANGDPAACGYSANVYSILGAADYSAVLTLLGLTSTITLPSGNELLMKTGASAIGGSGLIPGTMTNGYICTYTASGTLLSCNTNPATLLSATSPVAIDGHTDATAITAAQMSDPRCNIYNTGQGAGDVTLTLPAAAASLSCLFTVGTTVAANKWRVRAASGDKIYNMAADGTPTAGADNGYVGYSTTAKYPVIGNAFGCWSFKTDNYDWICKPVGNIVLTAE